MLSFFSMFKGWYIYAKKKSEELGKEKRYFSIYWKQIKENGYPPSVREIGKSVGLSSTATVHGYLTKLEQKDI